MVRRVLLVLLGGFVIATVATAEIKVKHSVGTSVIEHNVGNDSTIDGDVHSKIDIHSYPPPPPIPDGPSDTFVFDANENEIEERIIPIDPKGRAQDYEESFKAMKKENPDGKVFAIVDGQSISHIVDVKAMPEQSLVLFTIQRGSKVDHLSVKVEEIEKLGQWGRSSSPVKIPSSW